MPASRFTTNPDARRPNPTWPHRYRTLIHVETCFSGIGQLGTSHWDGFARRTYVEVVNRLILALLALALRGLSAHPVHDAQAR
jgi:hypothetical protein